MRRLIILLVLFASPVFSQEHPKFFISVAREAIWAQMKTDYDANPSAPTTPGGRAYKLIKSNADKTGTASQRDEDQGQWATWMYHITGDTAYRDKAFTRITSHLFNRAETCNNSGLSGNYSREYFAQYVWEHDWLYPGLTSQQRTDFQTEMNKMANCAGDGRNSYVMGGDSDQTTGDYMGMAMWFVSTGSYNTNAATYWNDASRNWGGLDTTVGDYTSFRNSVYKYVTTPSVGGEWLEGYEYSNGGTIKLLMFGAEAIRSWTGVDHFPEVTAWQQEAAYQFVHMLSPDSTSGTTSTFASNYVKPKLWGDTQHPRTWRSRKYYETPLLLAGVNIGTSVGPLIQDWALDRENTSSFTTLDPYIRGFLVFDPNATRGDWTTITTTKYVSGQRMLNSKTGWGASDSWFSAHFPPSPSADHVPTYWGEFELYKNGRYVFTHPQCYGGPCVDSRGSNGLSFAGVPVGNSPAYTPKEFRSAVVHKTDTTPVNYSYVAGTMGGSIWSNHRYGGCASYVMEHTRSLIWLKDWDVIVVYDRANSKATTFPTASLNSSFKNWSLSRPRKELYIHTNITPTQNLDNTDWIYDGVSAHARVNHLLPAPASATNTVENETTLYTTSYFSVGSFGNPAEKKFHVKIVPTATNQWEPFLNVWDAYANGSPSTVTLVQDTTNKVDGALVTKSNINVLTLFNSTQGPDLIGPVSVGGGYWDWDPANQTTLANVRFKTNSYSVTFNAGSNPTKIFLFDLKPTGTWSYTINGGSSNSLTVSSEGLATISIANTGSITLAVNVSAVTSPVLIDNGALPDTQVGDSYNQTLTSSGGNSGPYTYTLDAGFLPTGLTLSSGGNISGTVADPALNNSLIKTATQAWGNAGAISTNSLASGTGYVEFVATETSSYRMIGLSNGNSSTHYNDIDFAAYTAIDGQLLVYEAGVKKLGNESYVVGDIIRVGVETGGVVKYRKNGIVFYTSAVSPTYPLIVDTAFYTQGATIGNSVFNDGGGEDPVSWTSLSGVNILGNSSAPFTVESCDSLSNCGTKQFSIIVRQDLIITTTALDTGTVGASYSSPCDSAGGTGPFTYTLEGGTILPPGLSLNSSNCAITGTPTTLGVYNFIFRVTDSLSATDDANLSITINQAPVFALIGTRIQAEPSSTSVTIHFGVPGLKFNDSCSASIFDSDAILDTANSTTGLSRRKVYFTNLESDHTFGIEITCNEAKSERFFFTTLAPPDAALSNYTFALKPNPFLVSSSIDSVDVQCDDVDPACATNCDIGTVVDNGCGSGCNFTVSNFAPGRVYTCTHRWGTNGSTWVFFGKPGLFAVK